MALIEIHTALVLIKMGDIVEWEINKSVDPIVNCFCFDFECCMCVYVMV